VAPAFRPAPPARVTAHLGYYLVALAPGHTHVVTKGRACLCDLGADCPAVAAVADYLRAGGRRAADVPARRLIPERCPVCGGPVRFEPRLCSRVRGPGWACLTAAAQGGPGESRDVPSGLDIPGRSHYWQHMWTRLLRRWLDGGGRE
jgi:hypothetical protein